MIVVATLFTLGLVAIWLELYIHGGVFAVVGMLFILASLWSFAATYHSAYAIAVFLIFIVASIAVLIRITLWHKQKSVRQEDLYRGNDREGYIAATIDPTLIGKEGVAITNIDPGGFVLIEELKYPAVCDGPYIDKGAKIVVLSLQGMHLLVGLGIYGKRQQNTQE